MAPKSASYKQVPPTRTGFPQISQSPLSAFLPQPHAVRYKTAQPLPVTFSVLVTI